MTKIRAVYENGVLRPVEPLNLPEGTKVEVTLAEETVLQLTSEEWERRIRAAKSIQDWVELANACPAPESDFDVVRAISESRRLTGFRLPDPEPDAGNPS